MPKDFAGVMKEWKARQLHSGSSKGKVVQSQKQALAIAFSEQQKAQGKMKAGKKRSLVDQMGGHRR